MSRFNQGKTFRRYEVADADVEYPSEKFAEKLLALKTPGETATLVDKPEATYYVAALLRRTPPFELSFYADAGQSTNLFAQMDEDEHLRKKLLEGSLEELRREADVQYDEQNLRVFAKGSYSGTSEGPGEED